MSFKSKFYKKSGENATQLEETIAQSIYDLENSSTEWKNDLKDFYIVQAKEVDFTPKGKKGRNVYLVYVPFPCLKLLQKVHKRFVPELESRLKAYCMFVAKRTIQSKWRKTHKSQQRPNSRTLTDVHEAVLDDLLLPFALIGKRIRHRLDGSTVVKCILDQNDKDIIEDKLDAIAHIYKKISTKDIQFEFRQEQHFYTIKK